MVSTYSARGGKEQRKELIKLELIATFEKNSVILNNSTTKALENLRKKKKKNGEEEEEDREQLHDRILRLVKFILAFPI